MPFKKYIISPDEQQMVDEGVYEIGVCDLFYLSYYLHAKDPFSYENWVWYREEWNRLEAIYNKEFGPLSSSLITDGLNTSETGRRKELLTDMAYIWGLRLGNYAN